MGVFEMPSFATGTMAVAEAVAANEAATSIVGGGDSVSAAAQGRGDGSHHAYFNGWWSVAGGSWKARTLPGRGGAGVSTSHSGPRSACHGRRVCLSFARPFGQTEMGTDAQEDHRGELEDVQESKESLSFLDAFLPMVEGHDRDEILIFPTATSLSTVIDRVATTRVRAGAQTMHWLNEGPFTGQTSPTMLTSIGVHARAAGGTVSAVCMRMRAMSM